MKRWIAGRLFSTDDLHIEDTSPITDKEFYISLSIAITALVTFALLIRILGS